MKEPIKNITIQPFCCKKPREFEDFLKSGCGMLGYYGDNWTVRICPKTDDAQGVYVSASLPDVMSDLLIPVREKMAQKNYKLLDRLLEEFGQDFEISDEYDALVSNIYAIESSTKTCILLSERQKIEKYVDKIATELYEFIEFGSMKISLSEGSGDFFGNKDELIVNDFGHYRYNPDYGVNDENRFLGIWRPVFGIITKNREPK